jgi:hypothetical protein
LFHLGQFFGEHIPAGAGAADVQQPREIGRSFADSLSKGYRTVLGAEVLGGGVYAGWRNDRMQVRKHRAQYV